MLIKSSGKKSIAGKDTWGPGPRADSLSPYDSISFAYEMVSVFGPERPIFLSGLMFFFRLSDVFFPPPAALTMQAQRPAPQVQDARERLPFCVTLPGMAHTQHFMCSHLLPVPIGRAPAAAAAPCHAGSALRRGQL